MESVVQNVRYGARLLVKQPGFTAMALLVLALGIGATTAMFSLVNALLFKPLLIEKPEELVGCYSRNTKSPDTYRAFSYPEYAELRAANSVFTSLTAHNLAMVGLAEGDSTRRLFVDLVSANYFATFGVPLFRGRTFTAEEEHPGSAIPVAILSHSFWKKTGADPDPLGKLLRINGRVFTVVGVAAAGFTGSTALVNPELYLPLGMHEAMVNDFDGRNRALAARDNHVLILIGRLRPGLSRQAADAQLVATAAGMEKVNPDDKDQALVVRPLSRLSVSTSPTTDDELKVPSLLLLFMSGIVLLIASLNVANMILVRGTARRKEMAIRLALGAGRESILSQLFTEGLLLALLGGAAGLVVSYWSTRLLVGSLASIAPLDLAYDAAPDLRVLAATMGSCLLSTLLFSLGPAWNLSRPGVTSELKASEATAAEGGKPGRLWSRRNVLVIVQLSLSLMLLSTAGLFIRSSLRTAKLEPGFRIDSGLIVEVDPGLAGYDQARGAEVLRTLLTRLRAMPGVESASLAATVPFGMVSLGRSVQRVSDPLLDLRDPAKRRGLVSCSFNIVGTDYFQTMGIGTPRNAADWCPAASTSSARITSRPWGSE